MSVWNNSMRVAYLTKLVWIEAWQVFVPVYNGRWLHLTVHRDCLWRAVTHMRSHSYVYAFCDATLAVNNDDGSNLEWLRDYLSALNMRLDWFYLVLVTFWQIIHCSLQTKTNNKWVLWRRNRTKFTAASRGPPCDSTASCLSFAITSDLLFVNLEVLMSLGHWLQACGLKTMRDIRVL